MNKSAPSLTRAAKKSIDLRASHEVFNSTDSSSCVYRPTWIEIDLKALARNLTKLKNLFKSSKTRVLAVVKAQAYGHGSVRIAKCLEKKGVSFFGVSSIEEGIVLRESGIKGDILILSSLYPFEPAFKACFKWKLTPTISSLAAVKELERFMASNGQHGKLSVHLKMETGMNRIGAKPHALSTIVPVVKRIPKVSIGGVYTHFATARDIVLTKNQLEEFKKGIEPLRKNGLDNAVMLHCANSTATLRYPETHMDMVRSGIALYGGMDPFEPIARLKTKIVFLKKVPSGTSIGYRNTFVTSRESMVATLPVGYGDGLFISASNKCFVLLKGKKVPVCGLISMDMIMIDVTDISSAKVGDIVTVIGRDGDSVVHPRDWARWANRGSVYEVMSRLGGTRTPRFYTD
ncbi:alanine racemase [Elusimicrobiota bacterium]